jgi:anti-sigma factor RsiW
MNCTEGLRLLHVHADGELGGAKTAELERHFEECGACAAERESVLSLRSALRNPALRFEAPESLRRDVRRIARRSAGERQRLSLTPLLFWRAWAFTGTVLAVAVLLFHPGISGQEQLAGEAVASHIRSLMPGHLTDVASSDQHTVKPWFNGRLDFAPNVRDFAAEGFPLVGGRLDYLNNRAVAALVYRRNKHLINVFVWPAVDTAGGKAKAESRRGYSIIKRNANGLHYCLVSDLNAKELAELSELLGREPQQ